MSRTLLTGGSGFIAAHVLDTLLERGHSVVTTVRSQEKGQKIKDAHPGVGSDKLDFVVVEDIAKLDAFDKAVISDPPFDTVVHTASPFHFNITNAEDLLNPAINGTVGLLRAIKKSAPSVTRVVITSSFAAIIDTTKPLSFVFSEENWNPITKEDVNLSASHSYRSSKTFAERAAWEFIEEEKPNFTLATCNPPLVLGPVVHSVSALDAINTSSERIRDFVTGAAKDKPATPPFLYVDVRDIALSHVLAAEKPEAANQRFFIVAGASSHGEILSITKENFPELKDKLPEDTPPQSYYGFDNSKSKNLLGLTYRPLKETIVDSVKSIQGLLKE